MSNSPEEPSARGVAEEAWRQLSEVGSACVSYNRDLTEYRFIVVDRLALLKRTSANDRSMVDRFVLASNFGPLYPIPDHFEVGNGYAQSHYLSPQYRNEITAEAYCDFLKHLGEVLRENGDPALVFSGASEPTSLVKRIGRYDWGVTTAEDCYGHRPGDGPPGWALYDRTEDDPPIAIFSFEEDAEMVCVALRRYGQLDKDIDAPATTTQPPTDAPDLSALLASVDWPSEIEEVKFHEWRTMSVFGQEMVVPVVEIRTGDLVDETEGDWCKSAVSEAVPWLQDNSVVWVLTYSKS